MAHLDALVRRVDEDRWLASRFAPKATRERLVTLYALNYEIARTAETVSEGAIGAIRLAWWREAIEEIFEGKPARAHPVLLALAEMKEHLPRPALFEAMIEAREKDFDPKPFASEAEVEAYIDATAGGVMRLAADLCSRERTENTDAFLRAAARAWGYAGLLRSLAFWAARGRSVLPSGDLGAQVWLLSAATTALHEAHALSREAPSALFPAYGYAALTPLYLNNENVALLRRQWTLLKASLTGQL